MVQGMRVQVQRNKENHHHHHDNKHNDDYKKQFPQNNERRIQGQNQNEGIVSRNLQEINDPWMYAFSKDERKKKSKFDLISPENYDPWVYAFSKDNEPPYAD